MTVMARLLVSALVFLLVHCGVWAQSPGQATAPAKPSVNAAGKVDLVEGEVTVYDRGRAARRIRIGDTLYEGEGIVTGRDGELHLAMDDGGYLAVRPNTNMNIVGFQAQGRDDDKSILNLVAGSFRSITGWIGRTNPKSYQVRTPTATIGIRGTDHEPLVIPDGAKDGEPGTYDKVNAGGTVIESSYGHGRIEVTPNRAGFAPLRGKPMPRLLTDVPRFYRPTRNESRLFQKHQAVQKVADGLREERRRAILERRRELERKDAHKAELKREPQSQERAQRAEGKKPRVEERKPKTEERRREREYRDDAQRNRNRD